MSIATEKNHIGRKISRVRELRGMKQEALAMALGISQQSVSLIENSETIDEDKLKDIANVLGVSPEVIKNFSEEAAINNFNNFYDNSYGGHFGSGNNHHHCTFNPLDKLIEIVEENKKLYERLLQAEKDKNTAFEKYINK